jgi:MFS family permease
MENGRLNPWTVMLPVGLATCLSLLGDSSLYTVLPTHLDAAGVTLAGVGVLLSANRFIRLALNGPAGLATDRFRRRQVFVPAVFIGALSTALYALTRGFWPLLAGRLLWGMAWAGLWVSGNAIVLDIATFRDRGRWVGIYHFAFYLGAASGAFLGGILTDWLGFGPAMAVAAALSLVGAIVAWLFLPETSGLRDRRPERPDPPPIGERDQLGVGGFAARRRQQGSAAALFGVNRIVMAGILFATFSLFLRQQLGDTVNVSGRVVGISTVTGLALGSSTLIGMVVSPLAGSLSDRFRTRWGVVVGGLLSGVSGFLSLALGTPLAILLGLPLASVGGGSNQGLSTAIIGDLARPLRQGRQLGIFFTIGDLGSAIGPPFAFAMLPLIGLNRIYLFCAILLTGMGFVALHWALRPSVVTAERSDADPY